MAQRLITEADAEIVRVALTQHEVTLMQRRAEVHEERAEERFDESLSPGARVEERAERSEGFVPATTHITEAKSED